MTRFRQLNLLMQSDTLLTCESNEISDELRRAIFSQEIPFYPGRKSGFTV